MKVFTRSQVKETICFVSLFAIFSSCAVSKETDSLVMTPSPPDYASYLRMVQKKVQSNWKFPSELSGTQAVRVRVVLDISGKLINAKVVDSTDARLDAPALDAVNRASPFPPLPENLKMLAGEPLVINFTVSTKPK